MGEGMKAAGLHLATLLYLCCLYTAVADSSGLCKIINCMMGTCNDTLTGNPLDFLPRCQCNPGWSQPAIGLKIPFLPCVMPNCTLDITCGTTAPASAPAFVPLPPPEKSSLCATSTCGEGGSCKQTSDFTYVCHCAQGYENLLNMPPAACLRQCSFGADCAKLEINVGGGGGGGATAPQPSGSNRGRNNSGGSGTTAPPPLDNNEGNSARPD
ncbi:uncharacterized protein LOC131030208 [Cryptomeria japonica]|uniref:uncharacterized protein LOC131030208 n=1 Tax=Cryptomeria japonica TaxID=3369 RepID=UPI0027DA4DAA|nr:uncharacterized protein LOC131030208 [Cryptomeria japonica]